MNKQLGPKNHQSHKAHRTSQYEDEISDIGRKGGRVERERQQAHRIDLELRGYTYR